MTLHAKRKLPLGFFSSLHPLLLKQPCPTMFGNSAPAYRVPSSSGMARPQPPLACLPLLLLLLLPGATTATWYSSLCPTPAPAPASSNLPAGQPSRTQIILPEISTGHFSGGEGLHFAPDEPYTPRSFSFHARRTGDDATALQFVAKLTLVGAHQRHGAHPHSVSFDLEGYYYYSAGASSAESSSLELCMVGSGSYAREDGFGRVRLSDDVVLRLHVPQPLNLSRPFVTGSLKSEVFDAISLVAYADSDYTYGDPESASCTAPPPAASARAYKRLSCYRLRALLRRGYYSLEYGPGGDAPQQLLHRYQDMQFNQIRCARNGHGVLRAYMVFDANNVSHARARISNYTAGLAHGFLVGEEALVAEGSWNMHQSQFCLKACRVVRSGHSRANLAVRECGVGVSLWFPTVWSIQNRIVASGMIWNTSVVPNGDKSGGVISVSRGASYRDDLSYIKYDYTRVEEARKHYNPSNPALSKVFPRNDSYQDFAFSFYMRNHGIYGYASPVAIGEALVQGNRLTADDAFYSNWTSSGMRKQSMLNVSYDLEYFYSNSSADDTSQQWMSRQHRISAEGVYDTETGSLCMVGCQGIGNDSDCEVLVTAQFAPLDATEAGERVVGTISSLRKKEEDPLFFEALDFAAEGMYVVAVDESVSRMDMEGIMLVVSMTMSCIFTGLQLLHVKRHPEALPATSVTMLVILAVGYAVPLMLNLEAMLADAQDSRNKHFVRLTSAGLLELNEFMLRVTTMLAFVLQLRLLQLALASRRPAAETDGGKQEEEDSSLPSDAERSTLWICLPVYLLGAVLVWIVHMSDSYVTDQWNRARAGSIVDDLAAYAGLVLDGFLLPQVVWNALAGARVPALSPWFYAGVSLVRAAPHVYDVFRRQNYVPSWAASYVYASPRDDLFGAAWDVAVPCGAVLLAALLFLQQRLGGAFLCGGRARRPGGYETVSTLSS